MGPVLLFQNIYAKIVGKRNGVKLYSQFMQKLIIILAIKIYFAKNLRQSQKIVIITLSFSDFRKQLRTLLPK
jgi:hypothetical protein